MLATLHLFKTLTSAALWFFSGSIAMALTGALNLLHRAYGLNAPGLRVVCVGTNIIMLAFGIVSGVVSRANISTFAESERAHTSGQLYRVGMRRGADEQPAPDNGVQRTRK